MDFRFDVKISSFSAVHKIHCQGNNIIKTHLGSQWVMNHVKTETLFPAF